MTAEVRAGGIAVEEPTPVQASDYHCSACRGRGVAVAALVTFGGRSFALCHVCGRELATRLAALCAGPAAVQSLDGTWICPTCHDPKCGGSP